MIELSYSDFFPPEDDTRPPEERKIEIWVGAEMYGGPKDGETMFVLQGSTVKTFVPPEGKVVYFYRFRGKKRGNALLFEYDGESEVVIIPKKEEA